MDELQKAIAAANSKTVTEVPEARLKRLSPTALGWFEKDPDKFVLYYVLGEKRESQTAAMAIGSGFDARIKGRIEADLLGVKNRWIALFMNQVEDQHHEYVSKHSQFVLDHYIQTGAYAALMKIIEKFHGTPKFEFDAAGIININGLDIPIYGKPDAFIELEECLLVLDWKVNGYQSQASPAAGYVAIRSLDGHNAGGHKNVVPIRQFGMDVTVGNTMRDDWQTQLKMYQLMLHPNPHKPWVGWIEQLAYADKKSMRVASHRTMIGESFSEAVLARLYRAWSHIQNRHYYPDLSLADSQARTLRLANMDDMDKWMLAQ